MILFPLTTSTGALQYESARAMRRQLREGIAMMTDHDRLELRLRNEIDAAYQALRLDDGHELKHLRYANALQAYSDFCAREVWPLKRILQSDREKIA